jgi:hypothetical protein
MPVRIPVINPDTGVEWPNGTPRPLFVPTGQPVPNPNYDPAKAPGPGNQPFKQPGTTVTPRPTATEPWRVDVSPTEKEQAGPDPKTDAELNPPNPDPADPNNPDPDKPKPEEQQSLCEKHPDILACAKPDLDTPEGEIPKTTKDVTLTDENPFSGGGCPADIYFAPTGLQSFKLWDWNKACGDITTYVKPVVLLLATFSAFMILIPGKTE